MMSEEGKKRIQIALALALVIAAGRAGYILYQRHEDYVAAQRQQQAKAAGYSNADYYVTPKKLYPYDLKSAMQLTLQPVWVKEGYRYTYYRYVPVVKRVDFAHDAGLLGPIERLEIKDVMAMPAPGGRRQVVALFQKDGHDFAVPIGFENEGQYKIYSDEMFYVEDPHELYKHWPAEVWQDIQQHEVKPGMDELQADFAVGMGVPDAGASSDEKTVRYPNGGKPLVVTYSGGKATGVKAGT
ncbi:MAG TPA: hypothetical protein VK722_15215 [Candidatus Aquilonibacter sp.]|jgi:hypothetical protein|nr:hypothetical protein [Candidatus Aquilonibacter sp.]